MIALLGNILWLILGGFVLGLSYLVAGVFFCCTIIGIPFGIACFRIARFAFCPFGKKLVPRTDAGTGSFLLNLIWVFCFGLWIAIGSVISGIVMCCTIIGIPFGVAAFRIAKVSFSPFGTRVVSI